MTEEQKRLIPKIVFWKREIEDIEQFIRFYSNAPSNTISFFRRKTSFCYLNKFKKLSEFQCSEVVALGFLDYMREYKKHLEKLISECDTDLVEIADMYLHDEMELDG